MAEKKKTEGTKHHGGYAGDGKDLVPIREDGTPSKYDKYGNLVTENTGKGKGVVLKEYYQSASKNIAAPSPEQFSKALTRPYWSINDMPISYVYNSIMDYFNSLLEPVYQRVPVLDDDNEPILDADGKRILHTVLVNYSYKNIPTLYGLAQSIGVELTTLQGYLKIDTNNNTVERGRNSSQYGYNSGKQNVSPNRDNKLIDISKIDYDSILYKIYGDDILYSDRLREEVSRKTEKEVKAFLLKRARVEIMKFHEQRLGVNENVTGSLFALLNSRDGWTNEHTVKVELPDLMGKTKTVEELDAMSDYEEPIVLEEKDGEFVPAKDIEIDDE